MKTSAISKTISVSSLVFFRFDSEIGLSDDRLSHVSIL